jgi:hypothetical protein
MDGDVKVFLVDSPLVGDAHAHLLRTEYGWLWMPSLYTFGFLPPARRKQYNNSHNYNNNIILLEGTRFVRRS